MSFFGNIGKQIASMAKTVYNATINRPPQVITSQRNSGAQITVKSSLPNYNAINKAVLHLFIDRQMAARTLDQIGKASVEIMKEIVEPLRRKSNDSFVDSFTHKVDAANNSVTIFSNHPAAYAIQYGIAQVGTVQAIQEWMQLKPEFGGLTLKEERKVAYAIKKSIERGDSPGPQSTLGQLTPQGERRFDYVGEATKRLENEIADMIDNIYTGLSGP